MTTVSVSAETARLIEQTLATGKYQTASEVVDDAVRALAESGRRRTAFEESLRQDVALGIEELDRGAGLEFTDETLHEFFDDIERRVDEELSRKSKPSG